MATITQPTTNARAIVKDAEILGGEPTIAGTRVSVRAVVLMYRMHHGNLARVQRSLPTLSEDGRDAGERAGSH